MSQLRNFCTFAIYCAVASNCITAAPTDKGNGLDLIILHNNDMHARFEETNAKGDFCTADNRKNNKCYGGFARVAHLVRKYRAEEKEPDKPAMLYLNAGDTYTGTTWFKIYKTNITARFLNKLKPDAISLGNHEFDDGIEGLLPFLNTVDFPVLTSNLDLRHAPELRSTKSLMNSTVLVKNGVKIGIIGYLTPETKGLAVQNDVEFYDEVPSINAEANILKANGVKIIIALGHSGYTTDKKIAAECPDVDVVIGGHTNTFLYTGNVPDIDKAVGPYPTIITNINNKQVPVVQAYAFTKYMGHIRLKFDDDGNLITWDGLPILLDHTVPQDDDVIEILESYRPKITALQTTVVGRSKVIIDGAQSSCRKKECNFGNLATDAMLWSYAIYYKSKNGYWTDAPIALVQSGGIRASINALENNGVITSNDLLQALPFENKLAILTLSGQDIKDALEHSVERYSNQVEYGEFLQMAGMRVVYTMTRPVFDRVTEVEVLCSTCSVPKYSKLDLTKIYKVVSTSFLLEGNDGFSMFKNKGIVLNIDEIDSLTNYISKLEVVYPAVDGRIKLIKGGASTIFLSLGVFIISLANSMIF